ncbi:MAG: DNA replication and repair protein RecF [Gemmatimonadota bacterium]
MRLERLVARGFRNLLDTELVFPPTGVALLGANGQGKTNLLEAIYYPVFFRSFHGALDQELVKFGGPGFRLEGDVGATSGRHQIAIRFLAAGKKKQIELDGSPAPRLAEHVGRWLAVAFLPQDLSLAAGPATERRRYLDRMLAIADRKYFVALAHYRAALAQRNAALRQGRMDLAHAFDSILAEAGARVLVHRVRWADEATTALAAELDALGEPAPVVVTYAGNRDLTDASAWPAALLAGENRDRQRGNTGIGPHRDDIRIGLGGHGVREFGSTGQQRTVAIALKFLELSTLERARQAPPALLLDDVFAELDRERQERLATRLSRAGERQVFLSSPRADELPPNLELPVWSVSAGQVLPA